MLTMEGTTLSLVTNYNRAGFEITYSRGHKAFYNEKSSLWCWSWKTHVCGRRKL